MWRRVLLTGAAGRLGGHLRTALAGRYDLRVTDRVQLGASGPHEDVRIGELADRAFAASVTDGMEAILHFAGMSGLHPFDAVLQSNIVAVQALYEGARAAGVKRIIYASSNHVTGFYPVTEMVDPAMPARPDSFYGVTKGFGEQLSRFYFDRFGIETLCLRIGSCFPEPTAKRMLATWLSRDDLVRLVEAGMRAPRIGHMTIYGVSNNRDSFWDGPAARLIGYRPQDSADVFADRFTGEAAPADGSDLFQGGFYATAPLKEDEAIAGRSD